MEDFVIVVPVKFEKVFENCLGKCLSKIGIPYTLIRTDSNLPYVKSMNSILKNKDLSKSKYIMFTHSDITFLEKNWGKEIIRLCNSLPKLGYAGVEAITFQGKIVASLINGRKIFSSINNPIEVETCDDGIGIIPTKLFLERGGFDEKFFLNYFFSKEDFACWVRLKKKLKVYALPIKINHGSPHKPSNKIHHWGHKSHLDYRISVIQGWDILCHKWGYRVNTTALGRIPTHQRLTEVKKLRRIIDERTLIDNVIIDRLKIKDNLRFENFAKRLSKQSRDFWYPPPIKQLFRGSFTGKYITLVIRSVFGRIIGTAFYIPNKDFPDFPSIGIAIDDAFHHIGLGTKLMNRLFQLAIKNGCKGLYVGVPKRHSIGIKFYKSLGFINTGDKIARDGKPAWEMKWKK